MRAALRALVEQRADVNAADGDGTTALHWASHRDDLDSAGLLVRAGASVNAANDLGATPLWLASQVGSASLVRVLLQAGADPNLALLLGETPLMVASRSGCRRAALERRRRAQPLGRVEPGDGRAAARRAPLRT